MSDQGDAFEEFPELLVPFEEVDHQHFVMGLMDEESTSEISDLDGIFSSDNVSIGNGNGNGFGTSDGDGLSGNGLSGNGLSGNVTHFDNGTNMSNDDDMDVDSDISLPDDVNNYNVDKNDIDSSNIIVIDTHELLSGLDEFLERHEYLVGDGQITSIEDAKIEFKQVLNVVETNFAEYIDTRYDMSVLETEPHKVLGFTNDLWDKLHQVNSDNSLNGTQGIIDPAKQRLERIQRYLNKSQS